MALLQAIFEELKWRNSKYLEFISYDISDFWHQVQAPLKI